jgi:hypothetical protein
LQGIGDILRKYPENSSQMTENNYFIDFVLEQFIATGDEEGLATLTWLLGRFEFDDAPYQLERILEYVLEGSRNGMVEKFLVSSGIELFLKRPLETRNFLQRILSFVIDECSDPDTRDIGLMYLRSLRQLGPDVLRDRQGVAEPVSVTRSVTPSDTDELLGDFNKLITL